MILPRLEAETELGKLGETLAEPWLAHQMRWDDAGCEFADGIASVPRDAVANAAKPSATDSEFGLQHIAHARSDSEIRVADDRLGDTARAVIAGRTHRRDAVDELDLAQRRHLARTVLAVHRLALEEDRGDDVVAAADVCQQVGQEVLAAVRCVPEMMVWIDDRQ